MQSKHTPGPWAAEATRNGKVFEVYFGNAEAGETGCGWATLAGDNQAANARLIAAAPDLLEALQDLRELHWDWFRGTAYVTVEFEKKNKAAIAKARAAIAKATGETVHV